MGDTENEPRTWLAFIITLASIVGVIALAMTIVIAQQAASDGATRVLSSVLPVIGTWVGTVLAFYFGKANFEAAAQSVGNLAKQLSPIEKLRSVAVKDKMIRLSEIFLIKVPLDTQAVSAVLDRLRNANKGDRLPVVDDKNVPKYIIHRSELDGYLAEKGKDKSVDSTKLTFKDLFAERPDLVKLFETSFGVVPSEATLADAKMVMSQAPHCEDVFVSANGSRSEPIVGWLTDNIIQANLQAN